MHAAKIKCIHDANKWFYARDGGALNNNYYIKKKTRGEIFPLFNIWQRGWMGLSLTSACSDVAGVARRWYHGLRVVGRSLAALVEQRRAGVRLQRLTRRRVLRQLLAAIFIFGEGDRVANSTVHAVLGCQWWWCVSRSVLPFEATATWVAVVPVRAAVRVVALALVCPRDFTRAVERGVNGHGTAEVGLRVSIARLRWVPREGANIVPSWVGERRKPRQLSPRSSEIRKVKRVSGVDVYQRSHKPWIKEIMLAHFRGPDQQLLVYCNLTFNIVKPGGAPDWLSQYHVARASSCFTTLPPTRFPRRQNKTLTSVLQRFMCFLKIL